MLATIFMPKVAKSTTAAVDSVTIIAIVFVLLLAFGVPFLLPKKFAMPLPNLGHYLHHSVQNCPLQSLPDYVIGLQNFRTSRSVG